MQLFSRRQCPKLKHNHILMTAITLTKYLREVLPISPPLCLDAFFEKTSTCKFQVNYMQSATSLIHPLSHGASQFKADSGLFKSANRENRLPLSHIKLSGAGPLSLTKGLKGQTERARVKTGSGEAER